LIRNIFCLLFIAAALSAQVPDGYYAGTEGQKGEELKKTLHTIIRGHTRRSYTAVWEAIEQADEDPQNSNNVILLYTGRSQEKAYRDRGSVWDYSQYDNGNGTYNDSWNREHVWPKSHGFPNESDTAYTDFHHLRPADRTVNSSRGEKDFDWGDTWHSEATECKDTPVSFEPRDAVKGDVARMIFYMAVRYESNNTYNLEMVDYVGTAVGSVYLGKKSTLLQWHEADPVDDFERNRNNVIYSLQGNRNPFIDHPEFAGAIWGSTPNAPVNLSITEAADHTITLMWSDQSDNEKGFRVYVDGFLNHSVGQNITTTTVTSLMSGRTYTFTVRAFNDAGESADASITGSTTGGTAGPFYITEYADASGTGNYIYEFVEIYNSGTAAGDLSGYILKQVESTRTYTLPQNTFVPGGGYIIVTRFADQWDFESFWNVSLSDSVILINSNNSFPMINGDEQYLLEDPNGIPIDPDDEGNYSKKVLREGERVFRISTENSENDWGSGPDSTATPGWSRLSDTAYVSIKRKNLPLPESHTPSAALYPNPVNSTLTISLDGFHTGLARISFIDLTGKILSDKTVYLTETSYTIQQNTYHFPTGLYLFQIRQGSSIIREKFIILK
jgi:endonuclease I